MKVDDKLVDLPAGLKGLVVLNIPRYMYVKKMLVYFQDIIQFFSWGAGSEPWGSHHEQVRKGFIRLHYIDIRFYDSRGLICVALTMEK